MCVSDQWLAYVLSCRQGCVCVSIHYVQSCRQGYACVCVCVPSLLPLAPPTYYLVTAAIPKNLNQC